DGYIRNGGERRPALPRQLGEATAQRPGRARGPKVRAVRLGIERQDKALCGIGERYDRAELGGDLEGLASRKGPDSPLEACSSECLVRYGKENPLRPIESRRSLGQRIYA